MTILKGQFKNPSNRGKLEDVSYYLTPIDEIRNFDSIGHTTVMGVNGVILNVKLNGKVKTWKTRPDDLEVPVKYGLYEYTRIKYVDAVPEGPAYFVTIIREER